MGNGGVADWSTGGQSNKFYTTGRQSENGPNLNGYKFKFIISGEKKNAWSFSGLLFPFVPLKLLVPSWVGTEVDDVDDNSQNFSLTSHSSSPSMQTMICGWASLSFGSCQFMSIVHDPATARGLLAAKARRRRSHFTTKNPLACYKSRFEEHFDLGS